jgi:hypothetical protein
VLFCTVLFAFKSTVCDVDLETHGDFDGFLLFTVREAEIHVPSDIGLTTGQRPVIFVQGEIPGMSL